MQVIKDADFRSRRTGVPINVYPLTQESVESDQVSEYSAVLTEQDYKNVETLKKH